MRRLTKSSASGIIRWVTTLTVAILSSSCHSKCAYKAIFNFGDSNTDTGGFYAAFPRQAGPFGMTYFRRPSGRASDGRLIVDFLAQAIGIPLVSPYLQAIGSDFRHGANYATLASTVLLPNTSLFVSGLSPFALPIQINQMKDFKIKVDEKHSKIRKGTVHLPGRDIFRKSIYTFYIGQNDFTSNLGATGIGGLHQFLIPQVVSQIAGAIKEVYALGGRTILVLNLAPVGCYPAVIVEHYPHNNSEVDKYGCLVSYNNAVVKYNKMLKTMIDEIRTNLTGADLIYVDTHSVLLHLFQHPTSHGLKYGPRACCGFGGGPHNFDPSLYCGNSKVMKNGTALKTSVCSDPYNYVSWDGIHATESANKILTHAILNGSHSHPPFPLHKHCHLRPIG